jgi:MoaA/NifB/PqqE/SkfB family radical SAM enzyme
MKTPTPNQIPSDEAAYLAERGKVLKTSYKPRNMTINIDGRCNLKCRYCQWHSDGPLAHYKSFYLDYERTCRQIDALIDFGVKHIHVCALGEPFLNKDLFKIFKYIEKHNRPSVLTNGTSVVTPHLERLADANLKFYATDVDTVDPKEYTWLCGKDELKSVLSNLEWLAEAREKRNLDTELYVYTIVNKKYLDHLVPIARRMADIGINYWYLNPLNINFNGSGFMTRENALLDNPEEAYDTITEVKQVCKELGLNVIINKFFDPTKKNTVDVCPTLWHRMMLNIPYPGIPLDKVYGNVSTGCPLSRDPGYNLGNMFDDSLDEIWNGPIMQKLRHGILNDTIPRCKELCFVRY